jgi:hypothetical protein
MAVIYECGSVIQWWRMAWFGSGTKSVPRLSLCQGSHVWHQAKYRHSMPCSEGMLLLLIVWEIKKHWRPHEYPMGI